MEIYSKTQAALALAAGTRACASTFSGYCYHPMSELDRCIFAKDGDAEGRPEIREEDAEKCPLTLGYYRLLTND